MEPYLQETAQTGGFFRFLREMIFRFLLGASLFADKIAMHPADLFEIAQFFYVWFRGSKIC